MHVKEDASFSNITTVAAYGSIRRLLILLVGLVFFLLFCQVPENREQYQITAPKFAGLLLCMQLHVYARLRQEVGRYLSAWQ